MAKNGLAKIGLAKVGHYQQISTHLVFGSRNGFLSGDKKPFSPLSLLRTCRFRFCTLTLGSRAFLWVVCDGQESDLDEDQENTSKMYSHEFGNEMHFFSRRIDFSCFLHFAASECEVASVLVLNASQSTALKKRVPPTFRTRQHGT